jgi:hypothetical protein
MVLLELHVKKLSSLSYQHSATYVPETSTNKLKAGRVLTAYSLAGRLGFEPRQSAPKALDLPLVDRPVDAAVESCCSGVSSVNG